MNFSDYQQLTATTAIYPQAGNNPFYPTLGLAGEAGEIANKVKKIQRDNLSTDNLKEFISGEIGDCLWYCSQLASEFRLSLQDIAQENIDKLASRKERGKLQGSGDNR